MDFSDLPNDSAYVFWNQQIDIDPLLDPVSDPWNYDKWGVPGWFVTEFDEQNPLLNFDCDTNMKQGEDAQE
jgi:hypothetical protein